MARLAGVGGPVAAGLMVCGWQADSTMLWGWGWVMAALAAWGLAMWFKLRGGEGA